MAAAADDEVAAALADAETELEAAARYGALPFPRASQRRAGKRAPSRSASVDNHVDAVAGLADARAGADADGGDGDGGDGGDGEEGGAYSGDDGAAGATDSKPHRTQSERNAARVQRRANARQLERITLSTSGDYWENMSDAQYAAETKKVCEDQDYDATIQMQRNWSTLSLEMLLEAVAEVKPKTGAESTDRNLNHWYAVAEKFTSLMEEKLQPGGGGGGGGGGGVHLRHLIRKLEHDLFGEAAEADRVEMLETRVAPVVPNAAEAHRCRHVRGRSFPQAASPVHEERREHGLAHAPRLGGVRQFEVGQATYEVLEPRVGARGNGEHGARRWGGRAPVDPRAAVRGRAANEGGRTGAR